MACYLDFAQVDGTGSIIGSDPVRLWTGQQTKSFADPTGSGSYIGVGSLGAISSVAETTDLASKQMTLTLSGIPNEYIALALLNPYRDRTAIVYLILFNADYSAFEQITLFRGRMNQMVISDGPQTSTVSITCESRLIDLNKYTDSRYTDEAQKRINSVDNGLKFVASMFNKSIYWGSTAPSTTVSTGGGYSGGGGKNDGATQLE